MVSWAFKALFITGGGGIALLAGLLFVSYVAGGTDFATILASGDALRSSQFYPVILALVAFGAFTKSAQVEGADERDPPAAGVVEQGSQFGI